MHISQQHWGTFYWRTNRLMCCAALAAAAGSGGSWRRRCRRQNCRCRCLCRWLLRRSACLLRVPVKPDYGCPQSRSQSLATPARVLPPAHFALTLSLSHLTILEDLMKKAKPKTTKGVAKFQHCLNHQDAGADVAAAPSPSPIVSRVRPTCPLSIRRLKWFLLNSQYSTFCMIDGIVSTKQRTQRRRRSIEAGTWIKNYGLNGSTCRKSFW